MPTGKSAFNAARWAGKRHHHGCTRCSCRYKCTCDTPEVDAICHDCFHGRTTFICDGMLPRPCCAVRRPATRDDREQYLLAGPGPWFFCTTCFRQFTSPTTEGNQL